MSILVADIGGTNARFAIAEAGGSVTDARTLAVADYPRFEDAVANYLAGVAGAPDMACFAVAGPAAGGEVSFTNSPWVVHADRTAGQFGFQRCLLVNDFQAISRFAALARPEDVLVVKKGDAIAGAPILTIGPGTGLGQGMLILTGHGPLTVPTEGGHVVLATRTEEEAEIAHRIARRIGRVTTAEDVLSGSGLVMLHETLGEMAGLVTPPMTAADVTAAAAEGDSQAVRTVRAFCLFLGTVASDACLGTGARGGVMLAGGILPRIPDLLLGSGFAERFEGDSKMRSYTKAAPVSLLTTKGAALRGAAALLLDSLRTERA
ncbi:glucokinase [Parvularcula dongshanensis]|uniref:Glucokinase n=1 Tax=Parvularcula dongshanensis TaxID=1173995 RepID=A0A840I730_9PROT|nr:glucokinase [Parvularcula dongshanensis]MBB4660071.1 glucokinase [Parvularcula dongshanensis]